MVTEQNWCPASEFFMKVSHSLVKAVQLAPKGRPALLGLGEVT